MSHTDIITGLYLLWRHWPCTAPTEPPRQSTNFSTAVQWDNYSLFLNDQRIFLQWPLLVSTHLYTWGLTNPAPGVLDFNDWRALQPMFDAAKQAGIWIVLRPALYQRRNDRGGLALWSTSLTHSELRTNATDIEASWQQYIDAIINMTVENQITNGGPVIAVQIDNEYTQSPIQHAEYFVQLEEKYRANGIVVPLTYNDPGEAVNFINGTGAVDIYGVDSYPQRYDCAHPTIWHPVTDNYHDYHETVNPKFQGGSFDSWGGAGYDGCEVLTGPDFQDVFYKWNWASNVKLVSYYMLYGERALGAKFDELKRQGLFLRSSPEFRKTDFIATLLHWQANSLQLLTFSLHRDTISYSLTVPTSNGTLRIPQQLPGNTISLFGRQSRVIVTDYSFGKSSKLLYSTARILFAGTIGTRDVILLYGDRTKARVRNRPQHASIASAFFAPVLPGTGNFSAFWQFGSNNTILVSGPNLVRNASYPVTALAWHCEFTLNKERDIRVPSLTGWKFQDSLPEVKDGFDDSKWMTADHTTTNITQKPLFGDGRVLYETSCENIILWRGHFSGTSSTTAVNLTINGGIGFAASVFINSHFINTTSSLSSQQTNGIFTLPSDSVKVGQDNIVTVVQDHMGNDESPTERSPRGIPGFALTGGNVTTWKVQGKLGGYTNFPDRLRGVLNEGGLFGERSGWHLPGFSTAKWSTRSPSQGFEFMEPAGQAYRALLFVNGWQYGKRVANFGPQSKFPVPTGILNHNGKNTVALALWQLTADPVSPRVKLVLDDALQGGVGPIAVNNPGWSPREIE
ncbi:glycoside hydrolase superfamily [Irpex lacteus]|nr:glycoside hydrolase superfamily [Irpex lacteus]